MMRVALIDSLCCLTALPAVQEFQENGYLTKGVVAIACEVDEALVPTIWANRYNTYVLPAHATIPGDLPEGAYLLWLDLSSDPPIMSRV